MVKLKVRGLSKKFNNNVILNDINFDVRDGEFLSILGSSGCGKTTLIRILIGLETFDSGEIYQDGFDISGLKASERKMGMVFQNFALFPNMTVLQNVEYPLRFNKDKKENSRQIALDLIKTIGLEDHINKKPNKLSGGQQQRVAIARTLALNPEIILFDEPMSALDASLRISLSEEIKNVQKKFKTTIIYITHDQEESLTMSDRIMVMKEGSIEQIDTPHNIMNNPTTPFVKEFVVDNIIDKANKINKYIGKDL